MLHNLYGWAGRITPGFLPFALRAALRAFKFAPGEFVLRASCPLPCGPHCVRSNSLPANLSNLLRFSYSTHLPKPTSWALVSGWAGRIRTSACQDQNLVPYRLATAQYHISLSRSQLDRLSWHSEVHARIPLSKNLAGALAPGDGPISHVLILPPI